MKKTRPLLASLLALLGAATTACQAEDQPQRDAATSSHTTSATTKDAGPAPAPGASTSLATFAGGCFWCMEKPFETVPGVSAVISGYTGGHVENPAYKDVGRGTTGHTEAIQVHFDPAVVSYADLLEIFWRQIDPTDPNGQFVDRGNQYRPEIFYHTEAQRLAAESSRAALDASGRFDAPVKVAITPLERYWEAEEYHQDYYKKEPDHYHRYRSGSGRDRFLDEYWGEERVYVPRAKPAMTETSSSWKTFEKPSDQELRKRLSDAQYDVTQKDGTERPFRNEFWNNHDDGIYVDIVSGEPLFSSTDKFDSGTGWPSFTRPLVPENIGSDVDYKIGYARTEVRSARANSHLGHVFDDGPEPTGLRYCINSAALRFVPVSDLAREGYGEFANRFEAD